MPDLSAEPASPDYTKWPQPGGVSARLATVNAALRGTQDQQNQRILDVTAAVCAEVQRRTLRQFVPDTNPTTRFYDGSGTSVLEIDEFVKFVDAQAVGIQASPGFPLANIVPHFEYGKPSRLLVRGVGGVPGMQTAGVSLPIPTIFPAGRQNILVTARFGYALTIPVDLWECVACEIAYRLLGESYEMPGGRRKSIMKGDEKDEFFAGDGTGWHARFETAMTGKLYKRSDGRKLRSLRNPMT